MSIICSHVDHDHICGCVTCVNCKGLMVVCRAHDLIEEEEEMYDPADYTEEREEAIMKEMDRLLS